MKPVKSMLLLAVGLIAPISSAETIYVCWDGSGDYVTIQEGIDAAVDGDKVVVCDGFYTGAGNKNLDFGGKPITVRSENGPDNCIIDCERSNHRGFYFHSGETDTSVVDGFTITNADITSYSGGGGIYCTFSSPTIRNCVITENSAYGFSDLDGEPVYGGGIYCANGSPTILDCTIARNLAFGGFAEDEKEGFGGDGYGGGIYCGDSSSPMITNCTITDNVAQGGIGAWIDGKAHGAGICCDASSSPVISNCTITGNQAWGFQTFGGGICCRPSSSPTIGDCTIARNYASGGAGLHCDYGDPTVTNCTIVGNYGGGGIHCHGSPTIANCTIAGNEGGGIYSSGASPMITNCTIVGNYDYWGAGLACSRDSSTISNCTIAGNRAVSNAGALRCFESTATIANCTIVGNWAAGGDGGAVYCEDNGDPTITGCTIAGNSAGDHGGGVYCDGGNPTVANCILWDDTPEEIYVALGSPVVTYSDVQGGWAGDGNIDGDPVFAGGPSGAWSADGAYDPETYQITLTDANALWNDNELVGSFINPDGTQALQFVIAANTATTVTIWPDWQTIASGASWIPAGADYQIHDYHVTGQSPCIDTGDPDFVPEADERDIDGQMRVWDGDDDGVWRVDMGSDEFGSMVPGDLDGDGCVGQSDLGILLADWGCDTGDCAGDLDFDGDTDQADLGILLAHWGEGCP